MSDIDEAEDDDDLELVPFPAPPPEVTGASGEQRWREGRPRWVRPAGRTLFDWRQYEVADLPRGSQLWDEGLAFIRGHHYAKETPVPMFLHGLFWRSPVVDPLLRPCPNFACLAPPGRSCVRDDFCEARTRDLMLVGVALYSIPHGKTEKVHGIEKAQPRSITSVFPGGLQEALDLGRFVLYSSVGYDGETWFLARSREMLFRRGYRGFISFSDPMEWVDDTSGVILKPGHYGQIYQGSNAIYLGTSKPDKAWFFKDWSVFTRTQRSKIQRGVRTWLGAVKKVIAQGAPTPRCVRREEHDPDELVAWLDRWLPRLAQELQTPGKHKFAFIDPAEEAEWRRIERLRRYKDKTKKVVSVPAPSKKLLVPYPEGRDVWPTSKRKPPGMARYGEEYPRDPRKPRA